MTTKKAVKKVEVVPAIMVQYDLTKEPERWDEARVRSLLKRSDDMEYHISCLKATVIDLDKENKRLWRENDLIQFFTGWSSFKREVSKESVGIADALVKVQKEILLLNITKAFAFFTAGMLAGAVIMKFL